MFLFKFSLVSFGVPPELDSLVRSSHRRLAMSFNLCYRYMDDLIVFNNNGFIDYVKV